MAGGVGTGLFLHAICNLCDFIGGEEIDFETVPTDADIQEAKECAKKEHLSSGCDANTLFWIERQMPYRQGIAYNYPLPNSAKVLLAKE